LPPFGMAMNNRRAVLVVFEACLAIFVLSAAPHLAAGGSTGAQTMDALRTCLTDAKCPDRRSAAYELVRRRQFPYLVRAYENADDAGREYIVEGIYAFGGRADPKVREFVEHVAFGSKETRFSDTRYYALEHLADLCDPRALRSLVEGGATQTAPYKFDVPCERWSRALDSFGKCRYPEAKKVLLNSIDTSCLDVSSAAIRSLRLLYPHRCSGARTASQARACFAAAK